MANTKLVRIVAIKHKGNRKLNLELQLGKECGSYDVSIVDRNGIFGLELPDALGLKLRSFPPAESRSLVTSIKRQLAKDLTPA